ncbi:MAG: hypothetical protein FD150_2097 [Rhodobacteraceae bacterium]|nr:MAG: hypothetical protein FD150_2097 [Paracoccaceae bacterium]
MKKSIRSYALALGASVALQPFLGQQAVADGPTDERQFTRREEAAPAAVVPRMVAPLTGRLGLNGVSFDLGDEWVVDMGVEDGTARNAALTGTLTHILSNEANDRFEPGLFGRNQTAWVLQLKSFTQNRVVTTTRVERGDLIGFRLDLSVTGRCSIGLGAVDDEENYCTYTPGIATVPGVVDPETLVPALFTYDTSFAEVIPEATHDSLKVLEDGVPVFQRGEDVVGGPLVGVSFDIQNSGFLATEAGRGFNEASREEDITTRYAMSLALIKQNLYSNSERATADRTTRAFVLLDPDDWNRRNGLAQLAAWLLPRMERPLGVADGDARLNISNNLFFALGNARRPADGLTLFETGYATLEHPLTRARSAAETPTAYYNGFWLGFTPERETSSSQRETFAPVGPRLDLTDPVFAEGGGSAALDLLDNSSLAFLDTINQSILPIDFTGITDIFVQLGLGLTTQEAVRRITSTETSSYSYVPHLTFNGNITTGQSVFRYYLGAIIEDKANAYVGADYTFNTESGWSAYARGEVFSRPDLDHRNEIEASVSRTWRLDRSQSLTLGLGGVAVLKGDNSDPKNPELGDVSDRLDLVARWVDGPMNLNMRHRISEGGAASTTFGLGYTDGRFSYTAQYTPRSSESAYIEALAGVSWRTAEELTAPTLRAQVARANYNLGTDGLGSPVLAEENLFVLSLQAKF